MIVEFVGGPRDGQKMEVQDGTKVLRIPFMNGLLDFEEHNPSDVVPVRTLDLPIIDSRSGRHFVLWREA